METAVLLWLFVWGELDDALSGAVNSLAKVGLNVDLLLSDLDCAYYKNWVFIHLLQPLFSITFVKIPCSKELDPDCECAGTGCTVTSE